MNNGGYVYLVCDPSLNAYKIGVTRNMMQYRLKRLLTGNATQLHMVYKIHVKFPFRLETMLHNKFKPKHLSGEWYALDYDDITNFQKTCNDYIELINMMKDNPFFGKSLK